MQTTQPLFLHRGQPLLDEVVALRVWMRVRPSDGSDYSSRRRRVGPLIRSTTDSGRCYGPTAWLCSGMSDAKKILRLSLPVSLVSLDFKGNLNTGSYVWKLLDERNLDDAFWQMPNRIWTVGPFEDRKNPKAGTTFHHTRSNEDVLVVVEINLVLPRDSLRLG